MKDIYEKFLMKEITRAKKDYNKYKKMNDNHQRCPNDEDGYSDSDWSSWFSSDATLSALVLCLDRYQKFRKNKK